jgi:hypothetical protein
MEVTARGRLQRAGGVVTVESEGQPRNHLRSRSILRQLKDWRHGN